MLCHVSHVYETGCSLYFTVAAQGGRRPAGMARREGRGQRRDDRRRATITHHHAVGWDHKPWFAEEIGPGRRLGAAGGQGDLDPAGILNLG